VDNDISTERPASVQRVQHLACPHGEQADHCLCS